MILDHSNCFGWVQIVLVRSKSDFFQISFGPDQNDLNLTKMNWARLKQLVLDQNNLDGQI